MSYHDTGVTCNVGIPRTILRDVIKQSYIQSDDHQFFYKDSDNFKLLKPCSAKLEDIFKCNNSTDQFTIAKYNSKNWKTCKILITDKEFTSNLTNKTYFTRSFDDLTCKSSNVVYGLECSLCGLFGETKGQLKRMNGHRSEINHAGNQILYQYFNQPNHSVLSLKVRLLEIIYHSSNSPQLSTPHRRKREEYWIRLWVLLPRMDAMTRLIASGTSLAQEPIL